MEDRGVGPSELARQCGVSPAAVTAWLKKGAAGMRLENLLLASDYLGVSVEWLARGGSHRQAVLQLDHEEMQHIEDLRALLPQDRRAVLADVHARAKQLREHAEHLLAMAHTAIHAKRDRKR